MSIIKYKTIRFSSFDEENITLLISLLACVRTASSQRALSSSKAIYQRC